MSTDITPYLNLVTMEHAQAPKFMAMLSAILQPVADLNATIASLPAMFDLDTAVGDQLDGCGARIGKDRFLEIPITGVYFSWDTDNLGWDQGYWQGPFDPDYGITRLPDGPYRILLYATIAANYWDGTIPGAYEAWLTLFQGSFQLLIQDSDDMHMSVGVILGPGVSLDPVTKSLLITGALDLRPAGVMIDGYFEGSIPAAAIFSWDVNPTGSESGWDDGNWAIPLT